MQHGNELAPAPPRCTEGWLVIRNSNIILAISLGLHTGTLVLVDGQEESFINSRDTCDLEGTRKGKRTGRGGYIDESKTAHPPVVRAKG